MSSFDHLNNEYNKIYVLFSSWVNIYKAHNGIKRNSHTEHLKQQ